MRFLAALGIVYGRPVRASAAVVIALIVAPVLMWSGGLVQTFPTGGLFIDADLFTLGAVVATAILFGATLPIQWYVWRRAVHTARLRGVSALAALFSFASVSCCAPLLLPGLLSVLGVSGITILTLNIRLHQLRGLLLSVAIVLLVTNLVVALRGVVRSCSIERTSQGGQ